MFCNTVCFYRTLNRSLAVKAFLVSRATLLHITDLRFIYSIQRATRKWKKCWLFDTCAAKVVRPHILWYE